MNKVLLCPLNNTWIINYFDYKPRFNAVSSRNNLTRINLDDKNSKGAHWTSLSIDKNLL